MKPAPFQYFAPTTLDEALHLLAQHGYDAKLLAGGQSLIPTMNFRLSQPGVLIDLNTISSLAYVQTPSLAGLQIGAMTRQRTIEHSAEVQARCPLLHATMPYIAHVQIRNRGTIGGSLAHADPAAELPAVMQTLNAQFRVRGPKGERIVAARDFYIGLFTTALAPDEIITEIILPGMLPRSGWSIQEISRRHGDYALVGVTAAITLDAAGKCSDAAITLLSVGDGPVMAQGGMKMLVGETVTDALIDAVADQVAYHDIDPTGDIHASVDFRRHLAKVLTKRALIEARQRSF
ncbi:MAG: xanthine dehydrogenase family protein subunit M [Caldilineaceae bacterium]